jgi:hypothetical protein
MQHKDLFLSESILTYHDLENLVMLHELEIINGVIMCCSLGFCVKFFFVFNLSVLLSFSLRMMGYCKISY